jgi:hypothetical protein
MHLHSGHSCCHHQPQKNSGASGVRECCITQPALPSSVAPQPFQGVQDASIALLVTLELKQYFWLHNPAFSNPHRRAILDQKADLRI